MNIISISVGMMVNWKCTNSIPTSLLSLRLTDHVCSQKVVPRAPSNSVNAKFKFQKLFASLAFWLRAVHRVLLVLWRKWFFPHIAVRKSEYRLTTLRKKEEVDRHSGHSQFWKFFLFKRFKVYKQRVGWVRNTTHKATSDIKNRTLVWPLLIVHNWDVNNRNNE